MTIDHENRTGPAYEPKRPRTEEERRLLSEKIKAYNRRTGAITKLGNRLARNKRMGKRK